MTDSSYDEPTRPVPTPKVFDGVEQQSMQAENDSVFIPLGASPAKTTAEFEGIEDLNPTPNTPECRTWRWPTFAAVWSSAILNPSSLSVGAALLAVGLSWWEALASHIIGGLFILAGLILAAWAGVKYGIPFPVYVRSSFSFHGAQFCTITRGVVAIMWLSFQGANGLYTGIGVVAGDAFLEWGRINELVTWGQILIMAAYALLHCGVIAVGIRHFRLFVYAVAPIQCVFYGGILAWACTLVPLGESLSASETGSSASAYAWFVGVNSSVAAWSALVLNIADLSRYCPTQKDQIIGQSLGVPFPFAFTGFVGLVVAGATRIKYGHGMWEIPEYFSVWPAPWAVTGAVVNALSILIVNVMANLLSPMNDMLNLAPNHFNFRVCGYICMLLAFLLNPWFIFASDSSFVLTFLNGYGTITGAIAGIIIADFWVVSRRTFNLDDLYLNDDKHRRTYRGGVNWRAFIAMLASLLPCIPGFVATFPGVDATAIPEGLQLIYSFSWFFCLVVSGAVYIVLERTVTPDYKKVRTGADSTDSSDVRPMKSRDAITEGASTIV